MRIVANLKRILGRFGGASLLAIGFAGSGCVYHNPNPSTPYAFSGQPGQPHTAAMNSPQSWSPTSTAPVLPQAPNNPGPPVNVTPNIMVPPPPTDAHRSTGLLTVGENITISYSDLPPGSPWQDTKQRIGDDGKIILPYNVIVVAAGKTPNQLSQDIRNEYVPKYFVRFTANVKTEERFYFVGGETKIPNRYIYTGDMTVLRAIDTAGGFNDFANRNKIELRRANGQKFIINAKKAAEDPKLDLPVYPFDQVFVPKRRPIF